MLNEDQKKAASHGRGNGLVLAGPGTGKTSTLIARHGFLVSKKISPENIFVVTFTQKASEEIKERLGDKAGPRAWIGTFHGHCLRLLKRFNDEAGLAKNFKVLDPSAQQKVLRDIGIDWDQEDGDLLDFFSKWKDALISPEDAIADANRKRSVMGKIAAEHYQSYQEYLTKSGNLDFSDLVIKGLDILKNSKVVQEYISKNLPFALVDEFQDVNRVQVELLQAMTRAGCSIWAVGDDDQALYGWRGSNVTYTVNFEKYFTPSKRFTLRTNYRCDPAIIKTALVLIGNNKNRVRKELIANKSHKNYNTVRISSFPDEKEEASWIASSIESSIKKGANPKDMGILVRTSSLSPHIQQALEKKKIPMSLTGAQNFWDSAEVLAVRDLLEAIEKGNEKAGYRYRGGVDFIQTMNKQGPLKTAIPVGQFLTSRPPTNASAERIATWSDGVETVAAIALTFNSASDFKKHIASMSAITTSQSTGGVSITTVHSSKGLEYKHVFIAGCEAAIMPHRKSTDVEEERRLFYVALTRSKGAVDISFAKVRARKKQLPSPFLAEINAAGPQCVQWLNKPEDEVTPIGKAPNKSTPKIASQSKGMPKVYYRKDGSRTMIPPED